MLADEMGLGKSLQARTMFPSYHPCEMGLGKSLQACNRRVHLWRVVNERT